MEHAFARFIAMLTNGESDAGENYRRLYLSAGHVSNTGKGCPVTALGQDIARGSAAFTRGVDQIVTALAATIPNGSPQARREAALQQFSMLVGAVVIARATEGGIADEVLAAVAATIP